MTCAFVGLGSNMGDRERFIRAALTGMEKIPATRLTRVSSLYDSEAAGPAEVRDQPSYLNAVARLDTELSPRLLLWHLLLIEARLGRERRKKWGPRPIDLDLLYHGTRELAEPDLVLPHPRILERPFVLVPLDELDPQFVHPGLNRTIHDLLRERRFASSVRWKGRLWR